MASALAAQSVSGAASGRKCTRSVTEPSSGTLVDAKAEAIAAHGDHDDHWAALSAAGYELKTAARRMEQLYDKLGGHA